MTGGAVPDGPGAFYPPTLLADVDERSEAYRDEIFGPVLTVRTHDGDDDALRQANDTDYGLAASARGVPDHQARDERHHQLRRKALAPLCFQCRT